MRGLTGLCLAVAALAAGGHATAAPQQYDGYYGGGGYGSTFRCESQDNRYRHCAVDTRGGVELTRGLSKTPCIEGRNWGYDRGGVWVSHGCRAEFRTRGGWNGGGGGAQIVRCDSNDGRYRTCAVPRGGYVRLVRQISKTRCVEGHNWGSERGAIWVDRGCRAEFEVGGRGGGWGGGGGWDGGWNGGHDNGQIFRCDSNDRRTHYCEVDARRVSLVRQVSKTPCIEGRTWGRDRRGVWVTEGCRAEFRAW